MGAQVCRFQRDVAELDAIVAFTTGFLVEHGLDAGLAQVVDLATEELFVNMVRYNTETDAQIDIAIEAVGAGVRVSLRDTGVKRFDPTAYVGFDVPPEAGAEERGGLGIFLVLKMVDDIHYQYRDGVSTISFETHPETG